MNPTQRYFQFGDGQTHDATVSETSEALQSCQNYAWIVEPNIQGLTVEDAVYDIEVSSGDGWFKWKTNAIGILIINAFDDTHLPATKMRIVYDAGTETTGTVDFLLTQKR